MIKACVCFYICLFIISCKKEEKIIIPTISIAIEDGSIVDTVLFCQKEMISLETSNECLLNDPIKRITLFEDKIIMHDVISQCIFVFKRDGSFLFRIGEFGRGPREYIKLTDYCIDRNTHELILYANVPSKFMFFNIDNGQFLKEIPTEELPHEIARGDNSILTINYTIKHPKHYISCINYDSNNIISIKNLSMEHFDIAGTYVSGNLIVNSEHLNFSRRYNNTIYSLKEEKIIPRFYLDFGTKNLPSGIEKTQISSQEFSKKIGNYVFSFANIKETPERIYFSTHFLGFCTFSKNNLQGGNYYNMAFKEWGILRMSGMVAVEDQENRYIGFIKSVSELKSDIEIFQLIGKRMMKNINDFDFSLPEIKKFQDAINSMEDDQNPVLFLLRSKS